MLVYSFIVAFLILGLVRCDAENEPVMCFQLLPREEIQEAQPVPNQQQLEDLCPKMLKFLQCEERNFMKKDPESEEYKSFFGIKSIVSDVCDENSYLHKGYVESIDCFKSVIGKYNSCSDRGYNITLAYSEFTSGAQEEEEMDEEAEKAQYREKMCMTDAYALACIGTEIKKCGGKAHEIFVEFLHRSQILQNSCRNDDSIHTLRTGFLNFLEFEYRHPQIDVFREVFIWRRK